MRDPRSGEAARPHYSIKAPTIPTEANHACDPKSLHYSTRGDRMVSKRPVYAMNLIQAVSLLIDQTYGEN
jgi:hypothetical protein